MRSIADSSDRHRRAGAIPRIEAREQRVHKMRLVTMSVLDAEEPGAGELVRRERLGS